MALLRHLGSSLLILGGSLMVCNCGNDDPVSSISYSIAGAPEKVISVSSSLETDFGSDYKLYTLHLTTFRDFGQALSINIANWSFQNPPENGILERTYDAIFDYEPGNANNPNAACLELTGSSAGTILCEGSVLAYIGSGGIYISKFDGNTNTTVTITECNTSSRLVSGTFKGNLRNPDKKQITIEGSFKNIKYVVK